jgi:hypothetical protein
LCLPTFRKTPGGKMLPDTFRGWRVCVMNYVNKHLEFFCDPIDSGGYTEGSRQAEGLEPGLLAASHLLRRQRNRTWSNGALRRMGPYVVAYAGEVAAARQFDALAGSHDAQQRDGATGAV